MSFTPTAKSLIRPATSNALFFTPNAKSLIRPATSTALSFTPTAKSLILLPTMRAVSFTLLPISLALLQVFEANSDIPFLSLELGSENTLNDSAAPPITPPTAAPIAAPGPNHAVKAAPVNAPLPAADAIPNASSPALPFSTPIMPLSIDPLFALPVKAPIIPPSVAPISSLIPATFFSSDVFPATWLAPVKAPIAISNGANILPPIPFKAGPINLLTPPNDAAIFGPTPVNTFVNPPPVLVIPPNIFESIVDLLPKFLNT